MSENPIGLLIDDPDYRNLKKEERLTYDILVKIGDQKKAYQKLENEYKLKLKEIAQKVFQKESRFRITPTQAEAMISELKRRDSDLNEHLREKKVEILEKELQLSLPEQDQEFLKGKIKDLEGEVGRLKDEIEWVQENFSFAMKLRGKAPAPSEEGPHPPPPQPPAKGKDVKSLEDTQSQKSQRANPPKTSDLEKKENTSGGSKAVKSDRDIFRAEKTVLIPEESIGSQSDQIFRSFLQIKEENGWSKYPLAEGPVKIGNIRQNDNDIKLYDPLVSRLHGVISKDSKTNAYCYTDKGSKNGSFINGEPIDAMETVTLQNNDELVLGDTKIIVTISEDT